MITTHREPLTKLTSEQEREICEVIARAAGWDFIPYSSEIALPNTGEWYTPLGKLYGDEPPDYFTDLTAARALVIWLASQGEIVQDKFESVLLFENVSDWNEELPLGLFYLTAPLPTIARAAYEAIKN